MSGIKLRLRRLIHRGHLMPSGDTGRHTKAELAEIEEWADRELAHRRTARATAAQRPARHLPQRSEHGTYVFLGEPQAGLPTEGMDVAQAALHATLWDPQTPRASVPEAMLSAVKRQLMADKERAESDH